MIRFTNVSKRYPGGHEALSNISFHMEKGAMAFLTGHSGAGKSTLLKLIALIELATRGQLFLDGQIVNALAGGQRNFQLTEVFRGTHSLRAEIHDANGNGLFQSVAITFTVQQTSVQNQNNAGGPR